MAWVEGPTADSAFDYQIRHEAGMAGWDRRVARGELYRHWGIVREAIAAVYREVLRVCTGMAA